MRIISKIAVIFVLAVFAMAIGTAGFAQGWSSPLNLSNTYAWYSVNANMDFDSNNKIHMVFEDWSGSTHYVFYVTNMSGSWVKSQIPIDKGISPYIKITPDQVIHVFMKGKINGNSTILETHKPVSGGSWSAAYGLTPFVSDQWTMGMTMDSTGGIYVCWLLHDDPDPNSAYSLWGRYLPLGGSWGSTEQIVQGNSSSYPNFAQMVANGTTIYCTYERGGARYKKKVSGGTWGSEYTIATGSSAGAPRLAFAPNGEMAAAYQQNISPNYFDVWTKFSTDGGSNWSTPFCVSDNYYWLDRTPEICYDSNSDFHVVYQRFDYDGAQPDIWYRARVGGVWNAISNLSNTSDRTGQGGMQCIKSLGTSIHVLYTDSGFDGSGFEEMIYVTKGSTPPPGNIAPTIDTCTMSSTTLTADDTTQYTVTLKGSDSNGVADIDDMRMIFDLNTSTFDPATCRGYLAWGATQADVTIFGGSWNTYACTGGGYWGFCSNDYGYQYITPVSATTSVAGNQRTVTWTFKVKPLWATSGPLTGNWAGMWVRDAASVPYGTDWQKSNDRFGLTFNVQAASQYGTISGTVTASGGGAVSGATVSTTTGGYSTTTNASGGYTLSNVAVGTYSVVASHSNYNSLTNTGVAVTAGQTTTSNFSLTPKPGSISGTVTASGGGAISGASVSTTTGGYSATTDASGAYTLSNVAVGTYTVVASKSGYNNGTNSGVVVFPNANTVSNFTLTAAGNLVNNGNIEGGFFNTGWASTCSSKASQLPNPSGTWGWNNDTSYPFNTFDETTVKHAGSHALGFAFCQTLASPGKMGIAYQNINLGGAGVSKTFTVWAYHTNGNCPSIMCWNPGQTANDPYAANTAGRYQWVTTDNWGQLNTWVTRSMTVTADSTGWVTIMVGGSAHTGTSSGSKVYIDDVSVQ